MTRTIIAFGFILLVSACEPSVTLMNRQTGEVGTGTIQDSTFNSTGTLSISFANETYQGTWTAVADGGTVGTGFFNASGTNGNIFGTSTIATNSSSGLGTALLRSDKGNTMRCEFRYNSLTYTAVGACQKPNGEIFDLQAGL